MEDLSEELVLKALQIAFENNKRTIAYVKGILRDWHGKDLRKCVRLRQIRLSLERRSRLLVRGDGGVLARCESGRRMRRLRKSCSAFSGGGGHEYSKCRGEKTVLGSLLIDGELIKECRLTEHYFSMSVHKSIFQLMRKMEGEGQPIDLVTFISRVDPKFLEGLGNGVFYRVNGWCAYY